MSFKKLSKHLQTLTAGLYLLLSSAQIAQAADGQLTNPVTKWGDDPDAAKSGALFTRYAVYMWRAAMSIGALVVLGYYILAAFEWLSSGDDVQGVEKSRNRFINATIGLILLVGSYALVAFIGSLLFGENFNLLEITIPTAQ